MGCAFIVYRRDGGSKGGDGVESKDDGEIGCWGNGDYWADIRVIPNCSDRNLYKPLPFRGFGIHTSLDAEILLPLWEKEGGAKRRKDEGE